MGYLGKTKLIKFTTKFIIELMKSHLLIKLLLNLDGKDC